MYRKKITDVLIVVTLIASMTSCSTSRKSRTERPESSMVGTGWYRYSDIYNNNISNKGFFVSKAGVEIFMEGNRERFSISVRKDNSGRWLASVRSFAGIEVMRVYADSEQVILLDRLARRATVMNWSELYQDFGLTYSILPVLVGDMPEMRSQSRTRVRCDSMNEYSSGTIDFSMLADCLRLRPGTMVLKEKGNNREITVTAEQFGAIDGLNYTSVIEVREKGGLFHVKLSIDNLEIPWMGEIEFSIPSNYKRNR